MALRLRNGAIETAQGGVCSLTGQHICGGDNYLLYVDEINTALFNLRLGKIRSLPTGQEGEKCALVTR